MLLTLLYGGTLGQDTREDELTETGLQHASSTDKRQNSPSNKTQAPPSTTAPPTRQKVRVAVPYAERDAPFQPKLQFTKVSHTWEMTDCFNINIY